VAGAVNLVHHEKDSLVRHPQHTGDLLIGGRQTVAAVHDKKDEIRFLDRQLGLFAHLDEDLHDRCRFEAARVDQRKRTIVPFAVRIVAVPCGARFIDDDGLAPARKAVEQRGFADVGSADDCDDGFHEH